MSNPAVIVKYKTLTYHCSCCEQKLPEPKIGKLREFTFSKDTAESYADWNSASEFPEDMERMVPDFVYETIRFYAVDSDVKVVIEPSEIEKVREFILREVVEDTQGRVDMGKTIYLSSKGIEWLKNTLSPLSENDPYWQNENGYRDVFDRVFDKLEDTQGEGGR
jgi:hypothetical protein